MRRCSVMVLCFVGAILSPSQVLSSALPAPTWELKDLQGTVHRLEDWKGTWVLLKLGSTMCPACDEQLYEMDALREEIAALGVKIVDIYLREDRYSVRKYWERKDKKLTFRPTILYDRKGALVRPYEVSLIPQLVLVDPAGAMVWTARYMEGPELLAALEGWVSGSHAGGN